MASLYQRNRSPFWWIKCRDTKPGSLTFGKTIRFSTGLKVGIGPDTRKANQRCAELTLAEAKVTPSAAGDAWQSWVADYLKFRCKSPDTLIRYKSAWRTLEMFLAENEVTTPIQLNRGHATKYLAWRMKPNKSKGKYRAVHNTTLLELKILTFIMSEAVRRGYAQVNPLHELDIKRQRSKRKPEFGDEHLKLILAEIPNREEPERTFLANSFAISRYQGCRLKETHLNPMTDVDINPDGTGLIRFHIKGDRYHTAPLHPNLIPLFLELRKAGKTETYERPPNASRTWFLFMKRIGLKKMLRGACFHCIRVTVVTELARNNVPISKAKAFVGHASSTIHEIYQRLKPDDLGDCLKAVGGGG